MQILILGTLHKVPLILGNPQIEVSKNPVPPSSGERIGHRCCLHSGKRSIPSRIGHRCCLHSGKRSIPSPQSNGCRVTLNPKP